MTGLPVWEDGTGSSLPSLRGEIAADICVVGLGGSGLSCIGELQRLGASVVGLDAGIIGGGAAGRNGGFLLAGVAEFHHDAVAMYGRERASALYRRTLAELDRMTAETPSAIRRTGSLRIAEDDIELADCAAQLACMQGDNLPAREYDGSEGCGLLIPTDGSFQPLLRCRLLARQAVANGATLFENSRAVDIRGDRVATEHGSVRCRQVVVAVDGRLDTMLPELAGRVRSARLQMIATGPVPEVDIPRPVYRRWGYDYWQQLPDRRIVLGGLRDQWEEVEWTDHAVVTDTLQAGLERVLRERIGISAPITHRWAGIVGYTPSGLPIVDEVRPSVWAIGGYNGTGNVVGALCGRGVAQLALTGASELLTELRTDA